MRASHLQGDRVLCRKLHASLFVFLFFANYRMEQIPTCIWRDWEYEVKEGQIIGFFLFGGGICVLGFLLHRQNITTQTHFSLTRFFFSRGPLGPKSH